MRREQVGSGGGERAEEGGGGSSNHRTKSHASETQRQGHLNAHFTGY